MIDKHKIPSVYNLTPNNNKKIINFLQTTRVKIEKFIALYMHSLLGSDFENTSASINFLKKKKKKKRIVPIRQTYLQY